MCGISGIYAANITDQHQATVQAILDYQTPRGPDWQSQVTIKGRACEVLLGHNRLSIIDLSAHANQPMWDVTNRYCIVYNGEIYNYIELRQALKNLGAEFQTQSDTEVILNAFAYWGIDCLNQFHGPFAFALFDKQESVLWLCRDRFAVRPLFYTIVNHVLYFASSATVLAKRLNLKPNLDYVARGLKYLVYEDGGDSSPFENLFALPGGHYIQANFKDNVLKTQLHAYYNLHERVENLISTLSVEKEDILLQSVTEKLEKAVHIRLRSDVPLAISLSGGLDSSSVAALVSHQHKNTIGFSFGCPTVRFSEGPVVHQCAKDLNIQMHYVWPTAQEMGNGIFQTLDAQEAPFPTLSIVAQNLLYQKVQSLGIKVLLGGQGGDEAFMGYKKFLLFWVQQNIKQRGYLKSSKVLLQMLPMLGAELISFKNYWQHRHRYVGSKKQVQSALHLPSIPALNLRNTGGALWQRQLADITQFSLPTLLRYEDRNGMGHSVESRLPFLDHELIELGLALPESMKLRHGYGKWIIRKAMENKLPDLIRLARYKRGFDFPLSDLIKTGVGKKIRQTLNQNPSLIKEFIKSSENINDLFSDQQLIQKPKAMAEAITLLWLNKVYT